MTGVILNKNTYNGGDGQCNTNTDDIMPIQRKIVLAVVTIVVVVAVFVFTIQQTISLRNTS